MRSARSLGGCRSPQVFDPGVRTRTDEDPIQRNRRDLAAGIQPQSALLSIWKLADPQSNRYQGYFPGATQSTDLPTVNRLDARPHRTRQDAAGIASFRHVLRRAQPVSHSASYEAFLAGPFPLVSAQRAARIGADAGFSIGTPPSPEAPPAFKENAHWNAPEPPDSVLRAAWWAVFGDVPLNALESPLDLSNQTLKGAEGAFAQARALVRGALPQAHGWRGRAGGRTCPPVSWP